MLLAAALCPDLAAWGCPCCALDAHAACRQRACTDVRGGEAMCACRHPVWHPLHVCWACGQSVAAATSLPQLAGKDSHRIVMACCLPILPYSLTAAAAGGQEQPPHCGGDLQGVCSGAAPRVRDRPPPRRHHRQQQGRADAAVRQAAGRLNARRKCLVHRQERHSSSWLERGGVPRAMCHSKAVTFSCT